MGFSKSLKKLVGRHNSGKQANPAQPDKVEDSKYTLVQSSTFATDSIADGSTISPTGLPEKLSNFDSTFEHSNDRRLLLWKTAARIAAESPNLTAQERGLLDPDILQETIDRHPLLAAVDAAKAAKQDLDDNRYGYVTKEGVVVIIREKVDRLLKGFSSYMKIVDVAVGFSPEACIVWGAVRFFLQIFLNNIEILDSLEGVISRIITTMAICEVFENMYSECLQIKLYSDQTTAALAEELAMALPRLYAAIMIFAMKARAYFQTGFATGVFSAIKPFAVQFKSYVDDIAEKERAVERLAQMATAETVKQGSKKLQEMHSLLGELKALLAPFEQKLNEIHEEVRKANDGLVALQEGQEQKWDDKALSWLDAQNPREEFLKNKNHRMEGTCEWILDSPIYQQWKEFTGPQHLWVPGSPGAGKSVLAAFIIESLKNDPNIPVLYFFFRNGDPKTSQPVEVAASLILQLLHLAADRSQGLQRRLMEILKRVIAKNAGFSDRGRSDFIALRDMFVETLQEFPSKVTVVLDALDECSNPTAITSDLLMSPLTIGDDVRFLITGRPEQVIHPVLEGSSNVAVITMSVDSDIKVYLQKEVGNIPNLKRHNDLIISTIIERSSGMFRFAALLLTELKSPSRESISKRLKNLPTELNRMYESILLRLGNTNIDLRAMVLMWVATAYRPPRIEEIQYAYATLPYEQCFDPEDKALVTEQQILDACGSLVEISNGDQLRFTHLTVKEFLTSSPRKTVTDERITLCLVNSRDAHQEMAATCLTQLLSARLLTLQPGQTSPFDYSIVNWVRHASYVAQEKEGFDTDLTLEELWSLIKTFTWEVDGLFHHWTNIFPSYERSHNGFCMYLPERKQQDLDIIHPLHVAASYGISCIFEHPNAFEFNITDGRMSTPLIWAVTSHQEKMVKQLVENGSVEINAQNSDGRSALTIASEDGDIKTLTLLLNRKDLDINLKDGITHDDHACNALCWAVWNGHSDAVRLLLTRGDLDPNRIDNAWGGMPLYINGDLPLHYAILRGHSKIVNLLLADSRVNIDAKSRKGYTSLQIAARVGRVEFTRLLLSRGADFNTIDTDDDTARSCAFQNGHANIVSLIDDAILQSLSPVDRAAWLGDNKVLVLLLHEIDREEKLSRAISIACEQKHTHIVRLLLDHGASVYPSYDFASNILGIAAVLGDESMAKLLLKQPGIDADRKNKNGRTPLSLSCQKGHHNIVQILVSRDDVDVNSHDNNDDCPLIWAAYHGHVDAVRLLLAHPAINANSRNNYQDVALNYAVRYGHVAVVRLLLAHPGIDINTSSLQSNCPIHETALFAPAGAGEREGHNKILKLLLERDDLNVNATRANGDTILSIAAKRGFDDQVAILLTRSDVNRHHRNEKGETPLGVAKWLGYDKVVEMFVVANMA